MAAGKKQTDAETAVIDPHTETCPKPRPAKQHAATNTQKKANLCHFFCLLLLCQRLVHVGSIHWSSAPLILKRTDYNAPIVGPRLLIFFTQLRSAPIELTAVYWVTHDRFTWSPWKLGSVRRRGGGERPKKFSTFLVLTAVARKQFGGDADRHFVPPLF